MTHVGKYEYFLVILVVGLVLALMPLTAGATEEPINQLTSIVYNSQTSALDKKAYEPLLHQIIILRMRMERGDQKSIHRAMDHFMDMLVVDGKFGRGIPRLKAKIIYDFCAEVAPPTHPLSREDYLVAFGTL